ncbi:hypothetical protein CANMA_001881 [Candida margitis]|uniref:uncharacterized protein n=1 Tax=Candida margitis TaxID=1775924 RepID=UPI002226315F|nr:uncharacterized protein CANMA_001881 [Candida margitis]KAI5969077.1 hypothetical protein CANMA_001881 [Candida margitis]
MSSIPAWKRAGLSVQKSKPEEEDENDLLETRRIDTADLTKNQLKKVSNKRKLQEALGTSSSTTKSDANKKPPKRIKLPKNERKPPPVKDQLTYLKQFANDKSNWKFNKSKQNWILKNLKDIPMEYEHELILYLSTLQGGSRDRLVEELKQVIEKWNVEYEEMERTIEQKLLNGGDKEEKEDEDEGEKEGSKQEKEVKEESKQEQEQESNQEELNLEYVVRCKAILDSLIDDKVQVKGHDDDEGEVATHNEKSDSFKEEEVEVREKEEVAANKMKDKKDKKKKKDKNEKKVTKDKKDTKDKKHKKKSTKSESPSDTSDVSNLIINEVEV